MLVKLTWHKVEDREGRWLRFELIDQDVSPRVLDEHIAAIVRWSEVTKCGRRMAYNMWVFKTDQDTTAFVLRWS